MPRFYFDLHDGPNCAPDLDGDSFDAFDDARQHAQAILADMTREELPDGEERDFMCEVRDEEHDVVYRAKLRLECERLRKTATVD